MGGSSNKSGSISARFLNPWVLNFQKLGLELKCPLCLRLFKGPVLLPCNHIFCKTCLPIAAQFETDCPLCETQFRNRDMRPAPFMENMVTIYRSLDATFSANLCQPSSSDVGEILKQCPSSVNKNFGHTLTKKQPETAPIDNSCSRHSASSLTCNKRVQASSSLDVSNVFGKYRTFDERSMLLGDGGKQFNLENEGREGRVGGSDHCNTLNIEMNQAEQLSANSPPPFGDSKGTDSSSYECRDLSSENSSQKRHASFGLETEGHSRDPKRQKKLNCQQPETGTKSDLALVTSNSELKDELGAPVTTVLPSAVADGIFVNDTICTFCQSSKISEVTGPMLHYSNGKLVVADDAGLSNVIHAHRICIDWAPQVYYIDETVNNLEAEVARGAKLKCSKCGLRGAALGCYKQSCRRSYHVPCAMATSDCRWDCENFIVLCPSHSSVKFPSEKSKTGKNRVRSQSPHVSKTLQCLDSLVYFPDGGKEWTFCGSALSSEERILLVKFAKSFGATVSKFWRPDITHVIAATDDNGACTRTFKVLMAILNGKWILNIDWIRACMEARCLVNEESYEICLDNYGCSGAPKTGRLRAVNKEAPKLLNGLRFYFSGDFPLAYEEDLHELILAAGGYVANSKEELTAKSCDDHASPKMFVVYNLDSPNGCKVGKEVSLLWQRLNEAESIASETGARVIGHTWLVESIATSTLQPFVS